MVVIKLVRNIQHHFPIRVVEWALSFMIVNWGLVLVKSHDLFDHTQAFAALATIAEESSWGQFCIIVGLIRILFLVINGSFHEFKYAPHMRAVGAFVSVFFWWQITLSIFISSIYSTGAAVYPILFLLEIYNVIRSVGDMKEVNKRDKNYGSD